MNPLLILLLIVVAVAAVLFLLHHFHVKAVAAAEERAVGFFRNGIEHANATRVAILSGAEARYKTGVEHAQELLRSAEHKL